MKLYVCFILAPLALILMAGCERSNAANENPTQKEQENRILEETKNYEQAFSSHNPETVLAFWEEDAVYANPDKGITYSGHEQLAKEFKKLFQKHHADRLEINLKSIEFPESDKAVEVGRYKIFFSDGKPPIEKAFKAILVNSGNHWLFQNMRQIPLEAATSNADHLKELDWLVGDWIDTDEDVDIETTTAWKYNNFLVQHFKMQLYNQPVLEGEQIIGWDPQKKEIRSWIFDSDGGYGEGKWYKKGSDWLVKTTYTLANGNKSSAIHVYRKVSDQAYSWASEARDINGEILPNIPPIHIVKKEKNAQPATKENP